MIEVSTYVNNAAFRTESVRNKVIDYLKDMALKQAEGQLDWNSMALRTELDTGRRKCEDNLCVFLTVETLENMKYINKIKKLK